MAYTGPVQAQVRPNPSVKWELHYWQLLAAAGKGETIFFKPLVSQLHSSQSPYIQEYLDNPNRSSCFLLQDSEVEKRGVDLGRIGAGEYDKDVQKRSKN